MSGARSGDERGRLRWALAGAVALVVAGSAGAATVAAVRTGGTASPGAPDARAAPGAPGAQGGGRAAQEDDGPAYDGRFTFLRVRFDAGRGMRGGFGRRRGREPLWAHDMPRAERNFARILDETTLISPYMDGSRVLDLDDPELFRYPVAYIVEVGAWNPSDEEVRNLREYLLKGGFLIVDDFRGRDIYRFVETMRRVLPGTELVELDDDHAIFDSFFRIEDPGALTPATFRQYEPTYLGIFEDDDPSKRLMVVANYNNDIAEYWEHSEYGWYPIDLSNEAYKFGVNYVVYALTH